MIVIVDMRYGIFRVIHGRVQGDRDMIRAKLQMSGGTSTGGTAMCQPWPWAHCLRVNVAMVRYDKPAAARDCHEHVSMLIKRLSFADTPAELQVSQLPPTKCATKIHSPQEPSVGICVDSAALGNQGTLGKVVAWPTREYEDLEIAGLFGKQSAKPVHAVGVALNKLVV
jgi:hypothetical protein